MFFVCADFGLRTLFVLGRVENRRSTRKYIFYERIKTMKRVIALVLAIIMMFSMTSVSYAVDNTVTTQTASVVATNENSVSKIDNYMDYLEAKLDDQNTNFFVKIIVRLVIIGVMLGIINVKDFDEWFENTAPDTDTDNSGSNPPTDSSTDKDWEDGTELTLHSSQSLPYTRNGTTITDIKVIKEHYNDYYQHGNYYLYKYTITIEASSEDGYALLGFDGGSYSHSINLSENTGFIYSNGDFDVFFIENIEQ